MRSVEERLAGKRLDSAFCMVHPGDKRTKSHRHEFATETTEPSGNETELDVIEGKWERRKSGVLASDALVWDQRVGSSNLSTPTIRK